METITTYKQRALNSLQNKWGSAILTVIIYVAILFAASCIIGAIFAIPTNVVSFMIRGADGASSTVISGTNFTFNRMDVNNLNGLSTNLIIIYLIVMTIINIISSLTQYLITAPLQFGIINYFKRFVERGETELVTVFSGFKMYFKAVKTVLAVTFFTFLWTLLFIIPGIIAAIRYSQTIFIVLDDPEIGVFDAMKKSSEMMDGAKMNYFLLQLSFIGWALLCVLTCGIGFLFLSPYILTTNVHFYVSLKNGESYNKQSSYDNQPQY